MDFEQLHLFGDHVQGHKNTSVQPGEMVFRKNYTENIKREGDNIAEVPSRDYTQVLLVDGSRLQDVDLCLVNLGPLKTGLGFSTELLTKRAAPEGVEASFSLRSLAGTYPELILGGSSVGISYMAKMSSDN